MTSDDKIAALEAKVEQLTAALAPTPNDETAMRQWQSDMHNIRERRAAGFNPFSRADLEEMERAAPTNVVRDIALRDARGPLTPCSPGAIPPTVSNVNRPVGTGWREASPLTVPYGVAQADRLMDAQDAKDREALLVQEGRMRALRKAAEEAK